ncbi:MAG: chromosomal replication initiator protein DnaA, partial [Pseudomonadota bacterium]
MPRSVGRKSVQNEVLWKNVIDGLRRDIGDDAVDKWLSQVRLNRLNRDLAVLTAPTRFYSDWVERSYGTALLRAFRHHQPEIRRISVEAADDTPQAMPAEAIGASMPKPSPRPVAVPPMPAAQSHCASDGRAAPGVARQIETATAPTDPLESAPLDPRYTFESFIVGKPNELAHAAARRVAETANATFNPVFLYGGVGLGKTHLMHAIAWELQRSRPGCRVVYLSAEQFMYRFVQALRFRDTITFKQQFRSVDVLMVDDVQYIAGKDSTQEEFFHTFNALVDQQKQVVISADNSPDRIEGMEERIRSRLQWGLVVDIHPADYELRLGILQAKAEQAQVMHPDVLLDPKVLEMLAQRISSNVRVLEGALTRLFAYASYTGRMVNLDLMRECLS